MCRSERTLPPTSYVPSHTLRMPPGSARCKGHLSKDSNVLNLSMPQNVPPASRSTAERYRRIRGFSTQLCAHLEPEDCVVQSMTDASPLRWHLAHTTWFFETFILKQLRDYQPLTDQYAYLFNSYYNALGDQFPRAKRGVLSRPTMREVWHYREYVDRQLLKALDSGAIDACPMNDLVELGLQHEQQHQELMLTDIKHAFSSNPLLPVYRDVPLTRSSETAAEEKGLRYQAAAGGLVEIGHIASGGFAYDNELPRHPVFVNPFQLANRTATCGEYLSFMEDGGYARPELWLSEGWACVTSQCWQAPLYWEQRKGEWLEFTLAGLQPLDPHRPVCHISYFEADAFARWSGARLPTEFEWEHVANSAAQCPEATGKPTDNGRDGRTSVSTESSRWNAFADQLVADDLAVHPQVVSEDVSDHGDMLGNVWEWTSSSYAPYPGYHPSAGAIGEYNGKFMCNQYVLRGGSCATSRDHIRPTYRNFFPAHARWQFSGVRLASE